VELRAGMDKWVGGWLEGLRWAGLLKCLDNRVEALIFELMLDLVAQDCVGLLGAFFPFSHICSMPMRAGN